jgi:hypothetical protein
MGQLALRVLKKVNLSRLFPLRLDGCCFQARNSTISLKADSENELLNHVWDGKILKIPVTDWHPPKTQWCADGV